MALYAVHCASGAPADLAKARFVRQGFSLLAFCLLYTSDAADE